MAGSRKTSARANAMPATIDAYIAAAPADDRPKLKALRATIRKAAPGAEERISYRMPAFFQNGVLIYFAAFKNHIGLYPPVRDKSLMPEVAQYQGPKGNLKLPLAEPLPHALISRIVKSRLKDRLGAQAARRDSKSLRPQLERFLGRYDPAIARMLRQARAHLRKLVPTGYELVFDNYNALVFGFGPTPSSRSALLSIAGYPRWVTLFFLEGKSLPDPAKLLQGSGSTVRGIRLASVQDLRKPQIQRLIKAALASRAAQFAAAPRLTTIVKSVSPKQRSRRARA